MNFLNPLFLFGLAAGAIPILIHLFTRKRPREVRFSSLEFLSEVNRSEIRRIRIKQWLLLLLRTLAVLALALAMSRPVVKASAGGRDGAATTIVALVDRSGSMGALTRGGPLMDDARRMIESLLATLGHGDEMLLIPYDEGPAPISARAISDVPRLRAATQGLAAGARATDHRRALTLAAQALRESHALNRELFWISDFQASGFEAGAAAGLPPGPWNDIRTYLVPLSAARRGNVALVEAALAPAESGAALAVRGASFGAPAGDRAVAVTGAGSGDELGRGFLPVAEDGEADALIPLSRLPEQGGRVSIPDDELPLDNVRVFAAGRSGTLRVLLRHEGAATPVGLALAAGSPASGLVVESVDAATLPGRLADADVLALDDIDRMGPAELQATLDFLRGGGAVLLVLGRHADPQFWNGGLLRDLGIGVLEDLEQSSAGSGWRLRRRVAGHPVLTGFPARPGEALSTARFTAIRRLIPGSSARVLLEFDREHPALVESRAALAFLAPLDAESSDFPVSGAFLPLLHQAVKVLGRGTAAGSLKPGERYSAPAGTGAWRIIDEAGREISVELVTAEGATRLLSAPLERPGLYRVFQGAAPRASFAVNPDPRESDLTSVPEATLTGWFRAGRVTLLRPGGDLERRVREARYGRELWSWFVFIALACLLAETALGRFGLPGVGGEPRPASKR